MIAKHQKDLIKLLKESENPKYWVDSLGHPVKQGDCLIVAELEENPYSMFETRIITNIVCGCANFETIYSSKAMLDSIRRKVSNSNSWYFDNMNKLIIDDIIESEFKNQIDIFKDNFDDFKSTRIRKQLHVVSYPGKIEHSGKCLIDKWLVKHHWLYSFATTGKFNSIKVSDETFTNFILKKMTRQDQSRFIRVSYQDLDEFASDIQNSKIQHWLEDLHYQDLFHKSTNDQGGWPTSSNFQNILRRKVKTVLRENGSDIFLKESIGVKDD